MSVKDETQVTSEFASRTDAFQAENARRIPLGGLAIRGAEAMSSFVVRAGPALATDGARELIFLGSHRHRFNEQGALADSAQDGTPSQPRNAGGSIET
jgi:hypothetical protein